MTRLACFFFCLDIGPSPDLYVYNWTEEGGWGNSPNQHHHHVYPDGKPFPHHPGWKRCNFVYVFHTLGWTFYKTSLASSLPALKTLTFFHFSYSIIKNANTKSLTTVTLWTFLSWGGGWELKRKSCLALTNLQNTKELEEGEKINSVFIFKRKLFNFFLSKTVIWKIGIFEWHTDGYLIFSLIFYCQKIC